MKKKIGALLLAILMLVTLVPSSAFAANEPKMEAVIQKDYYQAGDIFEVNISISNVTCMLVGLSFNYDPQQMTALKATSDTPADKALQAMTIQNKYDENEETGIFSAVKQGTGFNPGTGNGWILLMVEPSATDPKVEKGNVVAGNEAFKVVKMRFKMLKEGKPSFKFVMNEDSVDFKDKDHLFGATQDGQPIFIESAANVVFIEIDPTVADKQEAQKVDALINALNNPAKYADKENVEAARNAYKALTKAQQKYVKKLDILEQRELELKGEVDEVANVKDMIAKLPVKSEVEYADVAVINEAANAYNALDATQKAAVGDITKLSDAKTARDEILKKIQDISLEIGTLPNPEYVTLDDTAKIEAVYKKFNTLTDDEKNSIPTASKRMNDTYAALDALRGPLEKAQAKIDALPAKSDVTLADKKAVEEARKLYDALNDDQKGEIKNLSMLTDAEGVIQTLMAEVDNVTNLIEGISRPANISDKADVLAARNAFDALSESQQNSVANYSELIEAEKEVKASEDKVAEVKDSIQNLKNPEEITLADYDQVKKAQDLYDALLEDEKNAIEKKTVTKLENANNKIDQLFVNVKAFQKMINALPNKAIDDKDFMNNLVAAEDFYYTLTEEEKPFIKQKVQNKYNNLIKQAGKINHNSNGLTAKGLDWKVRIEVSDITNDVAQNEADKLEIAKQKIAPREYIATKTIKFYIIVNKENPDDVYMPFVPGKVIIEDKDARFSNKTNLFGFQIFENEMEEIEILGEEIDCLKGVASYTVEESDFNVNDADFNSIRINYAGVTVEEPVIPEVNPEDNAPSTGDTILMIVCGVVLLAAVVGTVVVIRKKKVTTK